MINVAILGAGGIAQKMARTLQGMIAQGNQGVAMHSVASRDMEKAQNFANEYGFEKAYGSYEDMLRDPDCRFGLRRHAALTSLRAYDALPKARQAYPL